MYLEREDRLEELLIEVGLVRHPAEVASDRRGRIGRGRLGHVLPGLAAHEVG
jgi:hypothetical protein